MIFYDPWTSLVILLFALGLDRWLGEPFVYHPLVGFGRVAAWLEGRIRREGHSPRRQRLSGALAVTVLLTPVVVMVAWLDTQVVVGAVADILLLYLALGLRKLQEDGEAVALALQAGELSRARAQLGVMVNQNTVDMDAAELSRATTESVLENGNSAVIGTLFWFLLGGGAGVVLHRLGNTLASLWGYRPGPLRDFGRAATRLDALLNLIPAWLTVLLYALSGRSRTAIAHAGRQGRQWEKPNAGEVMAAGATALGLALGGSTAYGQQLRERPTLGDGRPPEAADIPRALGLVGRSVHILIWIQVLIAGGWSIV
jgi:adenosylcobinamide-phosphate synthase